MLRYPRISPFSRLNGRSLELPAVPAIQRETIVFELIAWTRNSTDFMGRPGRESDEAVLQRLNVDEVFRARAIRLAYRSESEETETSASEALWLAMEV
jgi:hypothetical protein